MKPDHETESGEGKRIVCPICGAAFICSRSPDCWCAQKSVPSAVTEHLATRYVTCVCSDCLERLARQFETG